MPHPIPGLPPLDPFALGMVPRQTAADTAHTALSAIAGERPEALVMGASVLFAALCLRCGLEPEEMFGRGRQVLMSPQDYHKRQNDSLQSLQDFAAVVVAGRETTWS